MLRRFMLLTACVLVPATLSAQKVTLTPFPMDGTFTSVTVQDMTMVMTLDTDDSTMATMAGAMQQEMAMEQTLSALVTVESEGETKRIVTTTERVAMEMTAPGQPVMRYDSDDLDGSTLPAAGLSGMIGQAVVFRLEGDKAEILNMDELIEAMLEGDDEEERAQQRDVLAGMLDASMFEQMMGASLRMLPQRPVGMGDTFEVTFAAPMAGMGDMTISADFTVEGVEGQVVRYGGPMTIRAEVAGAGMPFQMDMNGGGTMAVTYNAATGEQEVSSDMTMSAQMDMTGMTGGTEKAVMNMLMSMKQTQTIMRK